MPVPPVTQRHALVCEAVAFLLDDEAPRPTRPLIIPLRPDLRISRMLQQGSCFTLHTPGCGPIRESPSWLERWRIPAQSKHRLCEELRAIGVTYATLFADLDHLSREIRVRWGMEPTH